MKQLKNRPIWKSCQLLWSQQSYQVQIYIINSLRMTPLVPSYGPRKQTVNRDAETLRGYSRATRQLFQLWDQLMIEDGVLYRKFEYFKGKPDHLQLVVPNCMRDTVLDESHAGSLGGHLGENRTLSRI